MQSAAAHAAFCMKLAVMHFLYSEGWLLRKALP